MHPREELLWELSDLANHVEAAAAGEKLMPSEHARFSNRIAEDDGSEYDPERPCSTVTVFPFERSAEKLIEVFNRVGIAHEVKARNVESLSDEPPRKPLSAELRRALIDVDLTQENLGAKIREGIMLASAWRHAAIFRAEHQDATPAEAAAFIAELIRALEPDSLS